VSDIFISHVEEDADLALAIAIDLEESGYTTWVYEVDSLPGVSYLIQTGRAIEQSKALVLIVSQYSLSSNQVSREVVRAHESGRRFVPLLRDVTHNDLEQRQPEWREAMGAATSIRISSEGLAEVLPRVVFGLKTLDVHGSGVTDKARTSILAKALDDVQSHPAIARPDEADNRIELVVREIGLEERAIVFNAVHNTRIVIGRSSDCDVVLSDASASRKHAMLWFDKGKGWSLEDLHSTNGVHVNGKRVRAADIAPGDEIDIGGCHIVVRGYNLPVK
jgi:hypothetical protein